jgi:hypothetical protein
VTRRLANIPAHQAAMPAPRLNTRPESWFIASAGGRDAFRAGKTIHAAPFTSHDSSWHAWRAGWIAASRGEDITARYAHRPEKRAPHRIDYEAKAMADFRRYATDESIAPDLRDAAREILSLIEINARVNARYGQGGR